MSIKSKLKVLSSYIQGSQSSYRRHNQELESENKLELERDIAQKNFREDLINAPILRVRDLLLNNPQISNAVDIGSGAGWGSAALSKLVPSVTALEPSQAGIDIAKKLYPSVTYPNINWLHGFAEETLTKINLTKPTLFMTGCVLSHLRDKEVLKICTAINQVAPAGSVLSFAECWGDKEWHQIMWHIRTKDWWQKALPGWELDFHGPLHINGDCHMGFWGVKK